MKGKKLAASIVMAAVGVFASLGMASQAEAVPLTITTTGNGSGYVTSSPAGIDCGRNVSGHTVCTAEFTASQEVTLTTSTGAKFIGFSGGCTSSVLQCTLTMDEAKNVTAEFGKYEAGISATTNDTWLGFPISAQSSIQGGLWPKTGTLQFNLYGPDDADCSGASIFSSQATVSGTQQVYASGDFTPTQPGVYRWRVMYSGDEGNNPSSSACNSSNSVATIAKASTFIANDASDTTIGGSVSNAATLSGGQSPTGTIAMRLYAPSDTTCSGQPVYASNQSVTGNDTYGSGSFTPTQSGTYRWVSEYSGDAYNAAFTSPCSSAAARSIVSGQTVSISIAAADAAVGSQIFSTAAISQGLTPTGTITFRAYGPSDTECANAPVFTSSISVNGNGLYGSGGFTPSPGSRRWTATYSGDAVNSAASTACGAAGGTSTVSKADPSLSAPAPADITIGSSMPAQTTLSGGYFPTGTVTLRAYGPGDASCSQAPAFTSFLLPVTTNGNFTAGNFTPAAPGAYRWVASYSGDANNEAKSTACGPPSNVAKESPSLSSAATDAAIGEAISATASLTGGHSPGGTITFSAYGPDDQNCSGTPAFSSTATVNGNDDYDSGQFTPAEAGTYRWIASYSGDADNEAEASLCADSDAASTVAEATPAITIDTTDATIGSAITATADLSDGVGPGGTMTLNAFGPGDPDCSGTPAFTATLTVNGNGEYASGDFVPEAAGEYRWTAEYPGDVNNEPAVSACGGPGTISAVAKAVPVVAGSTSGDIRLGETINASTTFSGGYRMSGEASFTLYGPDDPTCAGEPAFTGTAAVSGNGTVTSPDFKPAEIGTYRWTGSYSGDANNAGFTGTCEAGQNVKVASPACPVVKLTAIPYKPAVIVKGRMAHGLRARILVSRASDLAISAKAKFEFRGKTRTVDFGERSLRNGGTRNLRLVLPKKWRSKLPLRTEVKLTLRITATPKDPKGCTSPPTKVSRIKTRVFWVLKAKQH
ncbi:MAG TPA: hypothetical protein VMF31_11455 [Solirubrobacterales bacterium]|nr:hypothetical protein [Solirubrobacterales bacterium]